MSGHFYLIASPLLSMLSLEAECDIAWLTGRLSCGRHSINSLRLGVHEDGMLSLVVLLRNRNDITCQGCYLPALSAQAR